MDAINTNSSKHATDTRIGVIGQTALTATVESVIPCTVLEPKLVSASIRQVFKQFNPEMRHTVRPQSLLGIDDRAPSGKMYNDTLMQECDVMSYDEISAWIGSLNTDLAKLKMITMPVSFCDGIINSLRRESYTQTWAEAADMFIRFGKKTNYTAKGAVLPEYFYPTRQDMEQFREHFVLAADVRAMLDEQKRKLTRDKSLLLDEIAKKDRMIDLTNKDLARLTGEPRTKLVLTEEEQVNLDLGRQIVLARTEKADAVTALKKVLKQLAIAERRIERFEGVQEEYAAEL